MNVHQKLLFKQKYYIDNAKIMHNNYHDNTLNQIKYIHFTNIYTVSAPHHDLVEKIHFRDNIQ